MDKVKVSTEIVIQIRSVIDKTIVEFENSISLLKSKYICLLSEYNDKKIKEIEEVIISVQEKVQKIIDSLKSSSIRLKKIEENLDGYLIVNLNGSSSERIDFSKWEYINYEHDYAIDVTSTNPNYQSGTEWQINCQRCVPTYELRRRGYNVTANARPGIVNNDDLCYHPFDVWVNPTILNANSINDISEQMAIWGDGARAQIVVMWKNSNTGHTFIAEQIDGRTHFIDPQTGSMDVAWYFSQVDSSRTRYCRIDNLDYNDRIHQCCTRC